MPAGDYYVGDLCYVLHDEWDEVCSITIKDNQCLDGEFTLKDGRRFAMYHTAWGDGEYYDQLGRSYGVDAGLIGCILIDDVDLLNDMNHIKGGQVVNFPHDFHTSGKGDNPEWDGAIRFGKLVIETNPDEVEEEE